MYLEKWIPEVLGEQIFPGPVLIERSHRVGTINKEVDKQIIVLPRVVVKKFLNYADKVRVMKAAGENTSR